MSKKTGKYVKCEVCGKDMYRSGRDLNKSKHFFCSDYCRIEGMSLLRIEQIKKDNNILDLEKWLREEYIENKRSTTSLMKELKVGNHTILKLLKRYNIKTRSLSESVKLDWQNNNEKKELVSENAKNNIGKNSKGRTKLKQMMQTEEYRYKQSISKMGVRNGMYGKLGALSPTYNPNLTLEDRIKQRALIGYRRWRTSVYRRDNYVCQCCGDKKGGNLTAHHLKSYDICTVKEVVDVNNGITLCDRCHKLFHGKYGYGNNTKEQLQEFIMNKKY